DQGATAAPGGRGAPGQRPRAAPWGAHGTRHGPVWRGGRSRRRAGAGRRGRRELA
ncbi:hypothetical protein KXX49_009189, partial [Aspergillus fumigatus]